MHKYLEATIAKLVNIQRIINIEQDDMQYIWFNCIIVMLATTKGQARMLHSYTNVDVATANLLP